MHVGAAGVTIPKWWRPLPVIRPLVRSGIDSYIDYYCYPGRESIYLSASGFRGFPHTSYGSLLPPGPIVISLAILVASHAAAPHETLISPYFFERRALISQLGPLGSLFPIPLWCRGGAPTGQFRRSRLRKK